LQQSLEPGIPSIAAATASGGIVLFDGTCAFCEGSVRFIAGRDAAGYFRFGASQSPQAAALLSHYGVSREAARSIVLIEDNQVYLRSTASLRIARRLPFPWRIAGWLLWVPRPLRDAAYAIVAAVRYRIAGPSNACEIPPPEIRERMI
jgi:predicted DCC family thiol-disulfide oxidoreductase YuxK